MSSSIASLYRRPRVGLEGYHSLGWGATPERLMQATRENFLYGCTPLNLHGLYYTTHGSFWEWAPPCHHFRMPYWEHMGVFLDRGVVRLTGAGRGTTDAQTVEAIVRDGRREVARVSGKGGTEIELPIPRPKLWSPDSPFLNDLNVTLREGRRRVDSVASYFGMRKIALGDGGQYIDVGLVDP